MHKLMTIQACNACPALAKPTIAKRDVEVSEHRLQWMGCLPVQVIQGTINGSTNETTMVAILSQPRYDCTDHACKLTLVDVLAE